jgi:hypothetical protein
VIQRMPDYRHGMHMRHLNWIHQYCLSSRHRYSCTPYHWHPLHHGTHFLPWLVLQKKTVHMYMLYFYDIKNITFGWQWGASGGSAGISWKMKDILTFNKLFSWWWIIHRSLKSLTPESKNVTQNCCDTLVKLPFLQQQIWKHITLEETVRIRIFIRMWNDHLPFPYIYKLPLVNKHIIFLKIIFDFWRNKVATLKEFLSKRFRPTLFQNQILHT